MERQEQPAPIGGGEEGRIEARIDACASEPVSQTAPATNVPTEQPARAQELQATVEDGPAERERETSPMAVDVPAHNVILPDEPTGKGSETTGVAAVETGVLSEERREEKSRSTASATRITLTDDSPIQPGTQPTPSSGTQDSPEIRAEQVPIEQAASLRQPLGVEPQMPSQSQSPQDASSTSQQPEEAVQEAIEQPPQPAEQPGESAGPSIPIEHARQPYSSQSSNSRFGPAASGESSGHRQAQAGAGSAARGMPMCKSASQKVSDQELTASSAVSGRPPFVETDSESHLPPSAFPQVHTKPSSSMSRVREILYPPHS